MLTIASTQDALVSALAAQGLFIEIPPFLVRVRSPLASFATFLLQHYPHHLCSVEPQVASFDIEIKYENSWRRLIKPQIRFYQSESAPFYSMPSTHLPILWEWGLNYCIASKFHGCLTLHAAVVAKGGQAMVIPAPPGSGKSTFCALLCLHGWHLLSDEFAMIDLTSGEVSPLPRPISLKNESIEVVKTSLQQGQKAGVCQGILSSEFCGTSKGRVALYSPPVSSHAPQGKTYPIKRVIFPRFTPQQACRFEAMSPAQCLMLLADNSFNFAILGQQAFSCLADIVAQSRAYQLDYSDFSCVLAELEGGI
ncbi:HprK-related kinase A [Motilimonas eburnea]|uniref:HprK-related kinase A n=1 Tax=Motilimonas eburnea TaxID=1737488 RepID=UPI001E5AD94B|nr:HprK-related kinase A [Motilimonas eburnea]MCE2572324.1 HprK-related kinase A [Motilimonas eburnea]